MNKQSFYDNQLVQNSDLNTALDNAEAADKLLAWQGVGYGITYGLMVVPVAGQMQINTSPGKLIAKDGLAAAVITGSLIQSVVTDTSSVAVAVGAGQERWVSVFAKLGRSLQGHASNGNQGVDNDTNYTQQPVILNPNGNVHAGTDQLYTVAGAPAAVGTASRPSLQSDAILLCDLYVVNGQTDFSGNGVIDYQRREMFQRTEQQRSEFIPPSGTSGFFLWQTFGRGAYTTRIYVSARLGGLFITTNAYLIPSPGVATDPKWICDATGLPSRGYSLGGSFATGTGDAIRAVVKANPANNTAWATANWDTVGQLVAT